MSGRPRLGELLVRAGLIDEGQLASALGEQRKWGRPLGMTLVRMGFLDEDSLVRALASQLRLPVVRLRGKRVSQEILDLVPLEVAEEYRCLPLLLREEGGGHVLYLAMEDPANLEAVDEVAFKIGQQVRAVLVTPSELDEALHRFYHWASFIGDEGAVGYPRKEAEELLLVEEAGAEPNGPERPARAEDFAPEVLLRVLSQLLVEKGVISGEELAERLRAVQSAHRDDFLA